MAEKFKCYVEPYAYYEFTQDYEDLGFSIWEIAKRILELCKNKEKLKNERKKAKELRTKIVGVGNTMDSYGDQYLQSQNNNDNKKPTNKNPNQNQIDKD